MTAPLDFFERCRRAAAKVEARILRAFGKGVYGVRKFIEVQIRETLSATAPGRHKIGGNWVTNVPATPGHPPRLVSGALRKSVSSYTVPGQEGSKQRIIKITANARSRRGFLYGVYHERHDHPFVAPTVAKNMDNIKRILGDAITVEFQG